MLTINIDYLCKKTNFDLGIKKNNYYKLVDIEYYTDNSILIIFEIDNNREIALSSEVFDVYYVHKYFYTKQEERQIKLNNLFN